MDANTPEPEPASPDPASDIPSLAELAADHPRALGAQHEGASPRSAERVGFSALLDEANASTEVAQKETASLQDRLDDVVCAITQAPMVDPVIDPEGNTYERAAIMHWLTSRNSSGDLNNTSPITRNTLTTAQLVSNRALREVTDVAAFEPEPSEQQEQPVRTIADARAALTRERGQAWLASLTSSQRRAAYRRRLGQHWSSMSYFLVHHPSSTAYHICKHRFVRTFA